MMSFISILQPFEIRDFLNQGLEDLSLLSNSWLLLLDVSNEKVLFLLSSFIFGIKVGIFVVEAISSGGQSLVSPSSHDLVAVSFEET